MTESLPSSEPGTQKRRSTRIVQAVPVTVTGVDALGQPFKERTTTVMVNCHGCKYQSKHYVPKNSKIGLEIPRPESALPPRSVQGRVVWVQRPRTVRELFQIGLEFEIPGNVWGIAFPPEDWFPYPEEPAPEIPAPADLVASPPAKAPAAPQGQAPRAATPAAPKAAPPEKKPEAIPAPPPKVAPPAPPEGKVHVMPSSTADAQVVIARQMAKMATEAKEQLDKNLRKGAEAAIAEEMAVVRQQLDAQLHDAVEHAIKVSMERVSESAAKKVVQQAAERTAAIVEEARKAGQISAQQIDAKVRQAVQAAVSQAAEQAALNAAQRTAAKNLKQTVEEVVSQALAEREASTPSLQILTSPEAAKQHLDAWRADLERTAGEVRHQTVERARVDATEASRHWQEQFAAALTNTSQKLGERIGEVSQAALAQAEREIAERGSSLRSSLDEIIAGAQKTLESLGKGLGEERERAEDARARLERTTKTTLDQTRDRLEAMLSAQSDEMSRRADKIINEKAQQLEPALQSSAEKIVLRISDELEEKLAPRLEQVQKVVEQLATAELQSARIQETIRQRVEAASEEALHQTLGRLKQETAKFPAEVEQACREMIAKLEREIEQRSTEAKHETFESLVKAADWYQKKAQTNMQASLEKALEQSTSTLRDRAAEVSSRLASELDHYRRTYVDHTQAQIEEAAKEVVEHEQGRLAESAKTASASFADEVHRVASESLLRFEESSRQAFEKIRSEVEFSTDGSLADFQRKLDQRMVEGLTKAREHLQAQLLPLVESWQTKRESQQKDWMEQLKKATDESIEQYRTRLENASNSWLLASATTLGQHSQVVLETLAKAAEKRLKETCVEVLSGMGDTLKEKLINISGDFGPEDAQKKKK